MACGWPLKSALESNPVAFWQCLGAVTFFAVSSPRSIRMAITPDQAISNIGINGGMTDEVDGYETMADLDDILSRKRSSCC